MKGIALGTALTHACLVKTSADDILKYFAYFSQKIGFDILCKSDNLYEISKPIFWGKKKKKKKILSVCCLLNLPR